MATNAGAEIIDIYVLYYPDSNYGETPRKNHSYHLTRDSAVLGQSLLGETETSIEKRHAVRLSEGPIFLIDAETANGLEIADEQDLRSRVKENTIESLSEAQRIALNLAAGI